MCWSQLEWHEWLELEEQRAPEAEALRLDAETEHKPAEEEREQEPERELITV